MGDMQRSIKKLLLTPFNVLYRIDPVFETKLLWFLKKGPRLELDHPVTYNEKIQWLKLFYRDPLLPRCADKYTARSYIEEAGLGHYLPNLL